MPASRNAMHAEESAEVEVLYANLDKLKTLTKKIQGSMARLETNGKIVKESIGPIYSNTQTLQITNHNVDQINRAIEKIRQPLDLKGKEERIIKAGPRNAGLPEYLGALKRVDRALTDLNATNLKSNQHTISEFNNLRNAGSDQLQEVFRSTLKEDVRPVEPLHYITKQLSFPILGRDKVTQLASICSSISATSQGQENPACRMYAEIRGAYIAASLQNLAMASINTSKRKSSDMMYRQGTSGIGAYASSMEGICFAEYENISRIFPSEDHGRALDATCRQALAEFSKTLRDLNQYIKGHILTDCFLAYEILEIVTPLSYRLEAKTGELKVQFTEALRPVRETAKSSLTDLLEDVRRRSNTIATLPTDGAPLPYTNEVMARLQALTLYSTPVTSILTSLGDGNWRASTSSQRPPLDVSPDGPTLLSHYLLDTLEFLLAGLEARSKSFHRTKQLQGVFLSNTLCLIDRSIRSTPELATYLSTPQNMARLDAWRKKGTSLFLDAWRDPSSALLDVQYTNRPSTNRPQSGSGPVDSAAIVKSLSSKDRDAIKDKFKTFNGSFDDLIVRQKSLYMEREVRGALAKEVQAMIEPLYGRFWDRYHDIDKKGKYVKYDKGALGAQLANLG